MPSETGHTHRTGGLSRVSMNRNSGLPNKTIVRYMPTYRLESKKPFNREICENIMKKTIYHAVQDFQYSSKLAAMLAKNLSEEIKNQLKSLEFDRYKIICTVTCGEKFMQDYCSKATFIWDAEKDGYISQVHDTSNFFVVATVYYLYCD